MNDKIFNKIYQSFDNERTYKFSQLDPFDTIKSWISTGSPSLDYFLNTHGYPTGIIEIRGKSQTGKTTFTLMAIKMAQKQYGVNGVFINLLSTENRDNTPYAKNIGIDTSKILIHKVKTIEQAFNKFHQTIMNAEKAVYEFCRDKVKKRMKVTSKDFDNEVAKEVAKIGKLNFLFMLDSFGNVSSFQEFKKAREKAEADEEGGMAAISSGARANHVGFRGIGPLFDMHNITFLIVNRSYDRVDGTKGKKSYGGSAIEFYPCIRWDLTRRQYLKASQEEYGIITTLENLKSDFGNVRKKIEVPILYGYGFVLSKR